MHVDIEIRPGQGYPTGGLDPTLLRVSGSKVLTDPTRDPARVGSEYPTGSGQSTLQGRVRVPYRVGLRLKQFETEALSGI
jgi:hypothetical protein